MRIPGCRRQELRSIRGRWRFSGCLLAVLGMILTAAGADAAIVNVETTDADVVDGYCGLAEAVKAVNQQATSDGCRFIPDGSTDTIVITVNGNHLLPRELWMTRGMTIIGRGQASTTISSAGHCAFCLDGGPSGNFASVSLIDMTIQPGSAPFISNGVAISTGAGPATVSLEGVRITGYAENGVLVEGEDAALGVVNSTIAGNRNGISVYAGSVTLENTVIQGNTAHGIFGSFSANHPGGRISIHQSSILDNRGTVGAGIYVDHTGGPFEQNGIFLTKIETSVIAGNQASAGSGGGIFTTGDLSLTATRIENNRAANGDGGGIYASGEARVLQIDQGTVTGNVARRGGGIFVFRPGYEQRAVFSVRISDTTINGNEATAAYGGGIATDANTSILRSVLEGNRASTGVGGGLMASGDARLLQIGNDVFRNNIARHGGGLAVDRPGEETLFEASAFINESTFVGNQAIGGNGGGLHASARTAIVQSLFDGNRAVNGSGGGIFLTVTPNPKDIAIDKSTLRNNLAVNGAGIALSCPGFASGLHLRLNRSTVGPNNVATGNGGGIFSDEGQLQEVTHVTISGNQAARGGGIYFQGGAEIHLIHDTIAYNKATLSNAGGGLYLASSGVPQIQFNIFAKNQSAGAPNVRMVTNTASPSTIFNLLDDATGGASAFPTGPGAMNRVADAKLDPLPLKNMGGVTAVHAPFKGSPALDGIPASQPDTSTTVDQRERPRPVDGDGNGVALNDIGSVEIASAVFEAEAMTVAAKSSDALVSDIDTAYSGGRGMRLEGNAPGDFVTFTSGLLQPGTYAVLARFKKASNAAKFSLAVGTTASISPPIFTSAAQDAVATTPTVASEALGTITITSAGSRYFKFTTLSNPSSGGYWLFIDAVWLVKTN